MTENRICRAYDLGTIDYPEAWQLQLDLVRKRQEGVISDVLLLLSHPPVITLGRAAKPEHLLVSEESLRARGFSLHAIERGGDITYHGPGQLVAYPILDLKQHGQDLNHYLRGLEEVVIRILACYNIAGTRRPKYTGVWVGDEKICAIGVAVKRWVSYHGLAFNLNPNLAHFDLIVPCGIRDHGVTSLARALDKPADEAEVRAKLIQVFGEVFGLAMMTVSQGVKNEGAL